MSGKQGGRHRRGRERGRRRSAVAAAGAMLLVPVAVAGEPAPWLEPGDDVALAGNPGGALGGGLDDPGTLGADGSKPENDRIGPKILELADKPDLLALTGGPTAGYPSGPLGIPGNMLSAYMRAAQTLAATTPNCNLKWPLLASIGRIESGHARGGRADAKGDTIGRILGPELNGAGPVAAIADTDGGRYDGNTVWDHAVGPMQFIPSTWAGYASDGNGDGVSDPNNIYDATLGAGKYLCSGGMDLSDPKQLATAIFRYNHSDSYVRTVILWSNAYGKGVTPLAPVPVRDIPQPTNPPSNSDSGQVPPPTTGSPTTRPTTTPPTTTTVPPSRETRPPVNPSRPTRTTSPTTTTTTTTSPTTTTTTTTSPSCETPTPTTTAPTTPTTTTTPVEDPCAPEGTDEAQSTTTTSPTPTSATSSTPL
ncbi:lytic transglycosylase domain-containing protein [Actinokineospora sp. UTMC 2448]|uniref:lytic transglycosylase domain-containing protein n=1 Tax=Actinokineospora sp. UTMC 2448 TaxID=2268449 RepID=UPI00216451B2|nr:lytic transglycosylase domain-containing protein [Actinokineospora sp. UTMC 2448]UVS76983.1 Ribonuclease G and E [Actinokineospora sp. UTMC 2448]